MSPSPPASSPSPTPPHSPAAAAAADRQQTLPMSSGTSFLASRTSASSSASSSRRRPPPASLQPPSNPSHLSSSVNETLPFPRTPAEIQPSYPSPNTASFPALSPRQRQLEHQFSPTSPSHRRTASSSPSCSASSPRDRSASNPPRLTPSARATYSSSNPGASARQSSRFSPGIRGNSLGAAGGAGGPGGIPRQFVSAKLKELAPVFYGKVDTSDCCILVPRSVLEADGRKKCFSLPQNDTSRPPPSTSTQGDVEVDEAEIQRRGSAPTAHRTPVLAYRLHAEYLSHYSTYFAKLLTNPPHQLIPAFNAPSAKAPSSPSPAASHGSHTSTANPCTIPRTPAYHLTRLPDPSSLNLIIHFIYFGDASVVEDALTSKKVDWKGLFADIEFLGLDNSIKVVCARWWRKHIKPTLALDPSSTSTSSTNNPGASSTSATQQANPPLSSSSSTFSLAVTTPSTAGFSSTDGRWSKRGPKKPSRGEGKGDEEGEERETEKVHIEYGGEEEDYSLGRAVEKLRL